MSEHVTRSIIAILIIVVFTVFMAITLMGFVAVDNAEIAKLVGAIFGYLTGLMSAVFTRYFTREPQA